MTSYNMLHLKEAMEIIEKLIKYENTYNKADYRDQVRVAIIHLNKVLQEVRK